MTVPRLWTRILCPTCALALLTVAQAFEGGNVHIVGLQRPGNPTVPSLRGRQLKSINLLADAPHEVIAVVSDYCHVCSRLKGWLAARPDLPIEKYRLMSPGQLPQGVHDIAFSEQPASVPRLLFVDHGEIISDRQGWSDDALWQTATEGDIHAFLSEHSERKSISEKKP